MGVIMFKNKKILFLLISVNLACVSAPNTYQNVNDEDVAKNESYLCWSNIRKNLSDVCKKLSECCSNKKVIFGAKLAACVLATCALTYASSEYNNGTLLLSASTIVPMARIYFRGLTEDTKPFIAFSLVGALTALGFYSDFQLAHLGLGAVFLGCAVNMKKRSAKKKLKKNGLSREEFEDFRREFRNEFNEWKTRMVKVDRTVLVNEVEKLERAGVEVDTELVNKVAEASV